jgi:hypothetical protein
MPCDGAIGSHWRSFTLLNCTEAKTSKFASATSVVSCKPVCEDTVLCYVCLSPPTVRAMNFVVMISDWRLSPRLSDTQMPLPCLLPRTEQRTTHVLQTSLHIVRIHTATTGLRDGASFWITFGGLMSGVFLLPWVRSFVHLEVSTDCKFEGLGIVTPTVTVVTFRVKTSA